MSATAEIPAIKSGYRGFLDLCSQIGFDLEPFQRKIASAAFGPERELCVLLPRGNGKSRLIATLALHHLLTTEKPAVYLAASSREQARIVYEYARDAALELGDELIVRHLELRTADGDLRVLASDAPKIHGLTPTLGISDELQAARNDTVYLAMRTAMQKRPGSRMWVISTAGQGAETTLGKLRRRALAADDIRRRGALVDARGDSLRLLEWAVPPEISITDTQAGKQPNPASWLTREGPREQREALPELAYRRFHLNQWTAKLGSWLPAGGEILIEGTKTQTARRRIVLPQIAAKAITEMPRWFDSPWVFVSRTGKQFTKGIWHRNFDKVRIAYGRPELDPYDLCHACATNLMRRGVEPWAIAQQLGHADHGHLVTTLYGHPSEDDARLRIKRAYGQNVTPLAARLQQRRSEGAS